MYKNLKISISLAVIFLLCILTNLISDIKAKLNLPLKQPYHSYSEGDSGFTKNTIIHIPQLCIISRTYEKKYSYLLTHLLSISHNPLTKPIVLLLITDEESSFQKAESIASQANTIIGYGMAFVLPTTSKNAEKISPDYKNDFGYSYTDAAIDLLLFDKKVYPCDYFIFTNGDNLYTSGFIDKYIKKDMQDAVDMVGFDFISRYEQYSPFVHDQIFDDGSRKVKEATFTVGGIDLGAFVIRKSVIEADSDMRFVHLSNLRRSELKLADGVFIEHGSLKNLKKRVHRQTLMVHQ